MPAKVGKKRQRTFFCAIFADYFKKIFLNRFGFEIDVIYKYAKKEGSHYELENEHKLNLRVAQIEKNMRAAQAAGDGVNEDSSKTAFSKGTSTSSKSENAASSGTKSNDGVVQENSRQSSFGDKNRTQFGQKGTSITKRSRQIRMFYMEEILTRNLCL